MNKNHLFLIIVFVLAIAAGALIWQYNSKNEVVLDTGGVAHRSGSGSGDNGDKKVTFTCAGDRSIVATFHLPDDQSVDLALSDGRTATLAHATSASGARYADPNEVMVFWNKGDSAFLEENGTNTYDNCVDQSAAKPVGLANPASTFCQQSGGTLKMATRPDGGQYGLCYFDDNRACEEWAMFRKACPVGGMKTTGYDTEAQRFCAWSGGKTEASADAICTFPDGSTCPDEDFYQGKCSPGNNNAVPDNYQIEKVLDQDCLQDKECKTPAEYMIQSRCAFISKCIRGICTVVCPVK